MADGAEIPAQTPKKKFFTKIRIPRRKPSVIIAPRQIHYITADKTTCESCTCFPKETPYNKPPVKLNPCLHTPITLYELAEKIVNNYKYPEAFDWSPEEVADWMENVVGLPEYRECILVNKIDGKRLLLLEDPSVIPEINIHYYDHIKMITAAIHKEYSTEFVKFSRSIALPPRYPMTHCTQFKARTGPAWGIRRNWDRNCFHNCKQTNVMPNASNGIYVEKLMNEFNENLKTGCNEDTLVNDFNKTILNDEMSGNEIKENVPHENNEENEGYAQILVNESNEKITSERHKLNMNDSIDDIDIDNCTTMHCNKDEFIEDVENGDQKERSFCPCFVKSLAEGDNSSNDSNNIDKLKKREIMEKYMTMNMDNNDKIHLNEKEYDDSRTYEDENEPQERGDILRWMKMLKPAPIYRDHWELVWYQKPEFPKVKYARVPKHIDTETVPVYKGKKKEKCREYLAPRKFRVQKGIPPEYQYIWMEHRPGSPIPKETELAKKKLKETQIFKPTIPKKSRLDPPVIELTGLAGKSLMLARRKMPRRKFLEFPGQPAP